MALCLICSNIVPQHKPNVSRKVMISLDTVWKEAPGQTKETLERLYVSVGLGIFPSIFFSLSGG